MTYMYRLVVVSACTWNAVGPGRPGSQHGVYSHAGDLEIELF